MSNSMKMDPERETIPVAEVLREMDLAFVAAGDHNMTVEEAVKFLHHPPLCLSGRPDSRGTGAPRLPLCPAHTPAGTAAPASPIRPAWTRRPAPRRTLFPIGSPVSQSHKIGRPISIPRKGLKMPLKIDYSSEGFPPGSSVSNGNAELTTSWDDLLWAAVTVGRPNRQYVFRHGNASMYEALFRWSLVRMALEQRGPSAYRLKRTNAAKTLDPTEKGAVNYFLGMSLCKLFSWKLLDAPWAMHLDIFGKDLSAVLTGRPRPDLIAETNSHDWIALESKGRISPPSNKVKDKAKEQAERLISVNGVIPRYHIGCISYFRNNVLQFFWRDPKPERGQAKRPISLITYEGIWRYYYQPLLELILAQSEFSEGMLHEEFLLPIERLDIRVGLHPLILKLLLQHRWDDAKNSCQELSDVFKDAGYQPDGIRIAAGSTWLLPFVESEMLMEGKES